MKKTIAICALSAIMLTSCMSLSHTVGTGATGTDGTTKKAWYALYGLVPINRVDTKSMAGGQSNYTIYSRYNVGDFLLNIFTSIVTIRTQTVTVTK